MESITVFQESQNQTGQTFVFKSPKYPSAIDELGPFKSDLQRVISNIEYRPIRNKLLLKLSKDIKNIQKTKELLIDADKSTNIFKISKDDCQKHLRNNITKTYKKFNRNRVSDINLDAEKIALKLEIDERVEKMQKTETFLTIKDYKEGFPHTLSFRLINPSRSDIGKTSKSLLDTINGNVLKQTNVNQLKNAWQVTWFKNIKSKKLSSVVNFDFENFYPSILIDLFTDAISYAKGITNIDDDQLSTIMQSRKTFLIDNNEPWVKKTGEENFDVPMGCYDGAEVCELVGRIF